MKPCRRRYQNKRQARLLDEAVSPMIQGLLSEGSTSTRHFVSTIQIKMRSRITNKFRGALSTDYEKRAYYWHMMNISNIIHKSIDTTSTFKEARLKVWESIDNIILEHQAAA